ncbi:MAG: M23 family metallopeptidase [Dermabacter sp.]|nr:M23 family metallopeptidase [Dermabacter sp.]
MEGQKAGALLLIAGVVPLLIFGLVFSIVLLGGAGSAACVPAGGQPGVQIDPASVPDSSIAGYDHEQLTNAAYIMQAGEALGLSSRDQTIGVMTAMGESSLRVIDYGDAAGPDSRGLFQQRDNGAWGSYEDRMDPFTSATNFFRVLMGIEDRDALEPTMAAHRVQRNQDPFHYAPYWPKAVEVVEGLSGAEIEAGDGSGAGCGATGSVEVNQQGWATPSAGPITSGYGMRDNPVTGLHRLHAGVDLAGGGCDGPIWAAQSGTVTRSEFDSAGNGIIVIDHGDGIETAYLHMYENGILKREGDKVNAGDQIGLVGSSGNSTGCHLHYEVRVNGSPTDPVPYMEHVGITLK